MWKSRLAFVLLSVLALAGCATDIVGFASKWIEPTEFEVVEQTLSLAEAGDWETIKGSFHESVEDVGSDEAWMEIAGILEQADFAERSLIGVNVNVANGVRNAVLTYEGPAGDGWYLLRVVLREGVLYGFRVSPMEQSMVSANSFSLGHIGLPHLLLLALGMGSIGIASLASYRVLNSQIRRRKLWAVLSWVMVGTFSLNWVTGQVGIQLLKVQLPPISFMKAGPAAPWIFGFGLPIFALIALRKVSRAGAVSAGAPTPEDQVPEADKRTGER